MTSHWWWMGSWIRYFENVSIVKTDPSLRRPTRRHVVALDRGEVVGEAVGRLGQIDGDGRRRLLPVAVLDRGGVLVPVGEDRIVLGQHEREPLVEDPIHVTDVARVLEG